MDASARAVHSPASQATEDRATKITKHSMEGLLGLLVCQWPTTTIMPLSINTVESRSISPSTLLEICELCSEAYEEDFTGAFEALGPGVHVIGRFEG